MKLVKEILYEKFSDESDPIRDMGIGMRDKIEEWINHFNVTHKNYIKNYIVNKDCTVDAKSVDISWLDYITIPEYIKFNNIDGDFACCFSDIATIKTSGPEYVDGDYKIYYKDRVPCTIEYIKKLCIVKGQIIIKKAI